jgi:hypothetical protein
VAAAGRAPALIAGAFAVLGSAAVVGRLSVLQAAAWRWPFVEASQAAGASTLRIGERHLLPHLIRPLAAVAAGLVPGFILLEATLGFLGFSVSPTTPSWGTLLWRAREAMHRGDWWLIVFPAAFMAVTAWAYAALADALGRAHPPTYLESVRLRLGREWGAIPALPQRRPAPRQARAAVPRQAATARAAAERPAVNPSPGVAGGEVSGGSSD